MRVKRLFHQAQASKPDFFNRLQETIELYKELYKNRFVVRPIELEPHNNDARWVSFIRLKQRYFHLPCAPLGSTGMRQFIPIITSGAVVAHQETWFTVNGFDERYDIGSCWYDNDLFDRFVIMRYPVILDQQLMVYRVHHKVNVSIGKEECKKIYEDGIETRNKGSIYSPNPFDLRILHEQLLKEKSQYQL